MNTSETLVKIAPALAKAQAAFGAVGKSGDNTFDRYYYATLEDYMRAIRPTLNAHGLTVISSITDAVALEDRTTQAGKPDHAVRVKACTRIMHESGEWIEAESWGEGQDRADKAVSKATTVARKNGIAAAFGLVTTDDPDACGSNGNGQGDRQPQRQQQAKPTPKPPVNHKAPVAAVQRNRGMFPPATQGDQLIADVDAEFKDTFERGLTAKRFSVANFDTVINEACRTMAISSIYELSPDERVNFLNKIAAGQYDRFRTLNGRPTAQVA